jgi:hypothetical protein
VIVVAYTSLPKMGQEMRYPEVRRLNPDVALVRQIDCTGVARNLPRKQLLPWPPRCSKIEPYDTVTGRMGGYAGWRDT